MQIRDRRGKENKVRDSQRWNRVQLRPVQQYRRQRTLGIQTSDFWSPMDRNMGERLTRDRKHERDTRSRGHREPGRERWRFSPPRP